jgi:hypothetical protein
MSLQEEDELVTKMEVNVTLTSPQHGASKSPPSVPHAAGAPMGVGLAEATTSATDSTTPHPYASM